MSVINEISRVVITRFLTLFYTCFAIGRLILSFITNPLSILGIFNFWQGPIFKAAPPKWNDEELGTHGFLSLSVSYTFTFEQLPIRCFIVYIREYDLDNIICSLEEMVGIFFYVEKKILNKINRDVC